MANSFCGNCGQELRPSGSFCPNCGQPASDAAQPHTSESTSAIPALQQQSRPPRKWGVGRVLLLVVLTPVLLAVAWIVFQIAVGFLSGLLGV